MIKSILNFLFGKRADIFNDKGEVVHKLPAEKWQSWNKRYIQSPSHNWRNHKGNES